MRYEFAHLFLIESTIWNRIDAYCVCAAGPASAHQIAIQIKIYKRNNDCATDLDSMRVSKCTRCRHDIVDNVLNSMFAFVACCSVHARVLNTQ